MKSRLLTLGFAVIVMMAFIACGGGDSTESADAGSTEDVNQDSAPPATPPADVTPDTSDPSDTPADTPPATPETEKYATVYDPDATYGYDDITIAGSYLKVDIHGLTDDQINRVIHRLRSEFCTCGCPSDPIDQCLINDPACGTAVTLAKQVIREEKTKG